MGTAFASVELDAGGGGVVEAKQLEEGRVRTFRIHEVAHRSPCSLLFPFVKINVKKIMLIDVACWCSIVNASRSMTDLLSIN